MAERDYKKMAVLGGKAVWEKKFPTAEQRSAEMSRRRLLGVANQKARLKAIREEAAQ